jgi:hypothetical protein
MGPQLNGTFKMAPGGYKHILVEVDKFTKWIEVCAVTTVTLKEAVKFIEDITIGSGYPTGSSPTWGRLSQGRTFGISAKIASLMSTTLQWPIRATTARSSVQTAWYFKASKTASSTTPRSTRLDG